MYTTIRLSGVVVARFEVPKRNVATLQKVDFGTTLVNQTSCLNGAESVTVQQRVLCVLDDADFDRIYPDSKSPGPASVPAAKDSSAATHGQEVMTSILVLLLVAAAVM